MNGGNSHPHAFSRYCMHCGQRLTSAVPEGDNKRRMVCLACGFIHYLNPRPVAGTIPVRDDNSILLVRRDIEPRSGFWVFPGGYMDLGETAEEAAIRPPARFPRGKFRVIKGVIRHHRSTQIRRS